MTPPEIEPNASRTRQLEDAYERGEKDDSLIGIPPRYLSGGILNRQRGLLGLGELKVMRAGPVEKIISSDGD